jgi:hypothetical protein
VSDKIDDAINGYIAGRLTSEREGSGMSAPPPPPPEGISVDIALPCPFCGEYPDFSSDEHSTIIECVGRDCVRPSWCDEAGYDGDDEHEKRAIAAWNHRPTASVEAGQPSVASLPRPPEGIDDVAHVLTNMDRMATQLHSSYGRACADAAALIRKLAAEPIAAHVAVCGPVSEDEANAIGSMIAGAAKMMADQPRAAAPLTPEGIDARRARDLHEALCAVAFLAPESRTIDTAERIAKAALEADRAAVQSAPPTPEGFTAKDWQAIAGANADSAVEWKAKAEHLEKFKAYVHQRLDAAGVPVDPESEHKAKGCRIGGRLDWLLTKHDAAIAAQKHLHHTFIFPTRSSEDVAHNRAILERIGVDFRKLRGAELDRFVDAVCGVPHGAAATPPVAKPPADGASVEGSAG